MLTQETDLFPKFKKKRERERLIYFPLRSELEREVGSQYI